MAHAAPKKTLKQKRREQRATEAIALAAKKEAEKNARYRYRIPGVAALIPPSVIPEKVQAKAQAVLTQWKQNRNLYFSELRQACRSRYVKGMDSYIEGMFYNFESTPMQKLNAVVKKYSPDPVAMSHLLEVCRRTGMMDIDNIDKYMYGIVNLACHKVYWTKNPDLWKPQSKNCEKQFFELVHYLLSKYSVPKFLEKCWLQEPNPKNKLHQEWFINLGLGENIRKQKELPMVLTSRMAHEFTNAPSNITIDNAFRWAQMKAEGADQRQIYAILNTPLDKILTTNEEFWVSVIRFFINNPMLDPNQYRNIFDYIQYVKYEDRGFMYENDERIHLGPEQPNFSMHRRDPNALLRAIEGWHKDVNRNIDKKLSNVSWGACDIVPWAHKSGKDQDEVIWSIKELLCDRELAIEGAEMHH